MSDEGEASGLPAAAGSTPAAQSPQPSWSSGLHSVQTLMTKLIYNDNVQNKVSALTCNDTEELGGGEKDQLDTQPLDRKALLQRLKTFRPGTWFGKPSRLSPIVCASHGWTNSSIDTLTCPACGSVIAFTASDTLLGSDADQAVAEFMKRLSLKHESFCIWHGHPPTKQDLHAFPSGSPAAVCDAMVERIAELAQLSAMPLLGGAGLTVLTEANLSQLLALLRSTTIPIMSSSVCEYVQSADAVQAPHSGSRDGSASVSSDKAATELHILSRRPCAFSLAAKVLAMLGWRLRPLSGHTADEDGLYAPSDCLLCCPVCSASVGLWSPPVAPATQGTLGCSGLLGSWGAGAAGDQVHQLDTMSIAGGVNGAVDPAWLPAKSVIFGRRSPEAPATEAPQSLFGSDAPAFGTSVNMSAAALATGKSPASAPIVGQKRPRSGDADGSEPVKAKAARIVAEVLNDGLKESVAKQLRLAGLAFGTDDAAFDPVMSHRSWCPWVLAGARAGWRQVLDAAAPRALLPDSGDASAGGPFATSLALDAGPRHIYRGSASTMDGKHSTIVDAAHQLLGRLSRPRASAPRTRDAC